MRFSGAGLYCPRRLGDGGARKLRRPGGGTVSRGATNLVGPTAGLFGLPTRQGIGPDQLALTDEKSTTHGEARVLLPRTVGNSRPRHTAVAEAAGAWRLGPKVYELCPFPLKDSSVTSVTVERAFLGGGGIPPRRLVDCGVRHRSRPRGRKCVPRRNEPSRTDCRALRPSYTARHRA
jgi:hypothetical protein